MGASIDPYRSVNPTMSVDAWRAAGHRTYDAQTLPARRASDRMNSATLDERVRRAAGHMASVNPHVRALRASPIYTDGHARCGTRTTFAVIGEEGGPLFA